MMVSLKQKTRKKLFSKRKGVHKSMTNKVREQEVWKQYPEFDFIEVSNLGRVRTKDRYVLGRNGSERLIKG